MKKIKIQCRKCKTVTNHEVLFVQEKGFEEEEAGFYEYEYYKVCSCLGCETVCFVYEYENSQMWFTDENGDTFHVEHMDIYPEPRKDNRKEYDAKTYEYVPDSLLELYTPVVDNYRLGHYILASVGIRMIIEGLCKELGVISGFVLDTNTNQKVTKKDGEVALRSNLEGKINGLFTEGILTENQVAILHGIRDIGNQSAHELITPSRIETRKALEVIEFIFTSVYELKKYAKAFKKKTVTN